MAISFNKESVWNLKTIDIENVRNDVVDMLVTDEKLIMAFQTIRDQLIFTDKRIIAVDVQGLTGKRKSFTTMPYSKIQFFSVQTPGFTELIPDSELFVMFSNSYTATFKFKGNVDIGMISRTISEYVL